ncbi:MAG TPA: helix-turn-helix transcriptional regulator [Candidatus Scatosoma pullicola]|nr:helix-turn-helix transcriptional regulator [Candidatus Scatosoma pullicola]
MKTIGENIAAYRKQKGLTQEGLAEICSVTPQAVSKWENDLSYPDITLLKPLSRAFGISVDALLDDGEGPVVKLGGEPDTDRMLLRLRVNSADGDVVEIWAE